MLELRCPNCGNVVGESKDGIQKFYYRNENSEPICPSCREYSFLYPLKVVLFFVFVSFAISFIISLFLN
jgi:hypothetical protein